MVGSCVLLLILTSGPLLSASLFEEYGLEQFTRNAEVIVTGRCSSVSSIWNKEHTLISTLATYQIDEAIKGNVSSNRIVVIALGGTVDEITQTVLGGPKFKIGERSLLFLVASKTPGAFMIFSLGQGKWDVETNPVSGVDKVRIGLSDMNSQNKVQETSSDSLPSLIKKIKQYQGKNEKE